MRKFISFFLSTAVSELVKQPNQVLENQITTGEFLTTSVSSQTEYEEYTTIVSVTGNSTLADDFLGSYDICNMSSKVLKEEQSINIHSPNYPENYDGYNSCTVTISSDKILVLSFLDMELESSSSGSCYDYLSVDGVKFCGDSIVRIY